MVHYGECFLGQNVFLGSFPLQYCKWPLAKMKNVSRSIIHPYYIYLTLHGSRLIYAPFMLTLSFYSAPWSCVNAKTTRVSNEPVMYTLPVHCSTVRNPENPKTNTSHYILGILECTFFYARNSVWEKRHIYIHLYIQDWCLASVVALVVCNSKIPNVYFWKCW